jgi:hypothetical protein
MIVCDDFLFLHLHKSGGTFVNELMLRCLPNAHRVGYHLPYARLPEAYRALPVLGVVRNPWAYYVSWFHFQSGQAAPNALYRVCSQDGRLGFADTIHNLVTLEGSPERIRALSDAVPDHFVNYGLNLTRACVASLGGSGLGFYSFLYRRLFHGAADVTLIHVENLRPELRAFLRRLGASNPAADQFITSAPMLNTTAHGPHRGYYPPALRDLVARMDASLIADHGYRF